MLDDDYDYKPGFQGHDRMREVAERAFRGQEPSSMTPPQSSSSKARQRMRLYKDGGSVKRHALTRQQTELYVPGLQRNPKHSTQENFQKVMHKRNGGDTNMRRVKVEHCMAMPRNKMAKGGKAAREQGYDLGGFVRSIASPSQRRLAGAISSLVRGKKSGGRAEQNYDFGGFVGDALRKAGKLGRDVFEGSRGDLEKIGRKAWSAGRKPLEGMARDVLSRGSKGDIRGALEQFGKGASRAGRDVFHEIEGDLPGLASSVFRSGKKSLGLKRGGRAAQDYDFGGFVKGIGRGFEKAGRGIKSGAEFIGKKGYGLGKSIYKGTKDDLGKAAKHAWEASKGDLGKIAKGALERGMTGDYRGALEGAAKDLQGTGKKAFEASKGDLGRAGMGAFQAGRKHVGLKRGGSARSNAEGMMVGEHPSHRRPHFDYESQMRGEHCISKAGGKRMAAGGVAKIRHKQANSKGLPINRRADIQRG